MKQKINELLDRPWTTRGYLKLTGITCVIYVIYVIFVGVWYIKLYWDEIKGWFDKKFGKKGTKKED